MIPNVEHPTTISFCQFQKIQKLTTPQNFKKPISNFQTSVEIVRFNIINFSSCPTSKSPPWLISWHHDDPMINESDRICFYKKYNIKVEWIIKAILDQTCNNI